VTDDCPDCSCNVDPRHRKRALLLSYFTVIYNIIEGIVSVFAGAVAGSVALVTFGLDSFIESLSGGVMIWRFSIHEESTEHAEEIERKAARMVGVTFLILAAYVAIESSRKLYYAEKPDASLVGIAITTVSLIVMPLLFIAKRRTGTAIGSGSLLADAKQTLVCMMLSAAVLTGLGLNYLYGFWQADPIAGLLIAVFLVREGRGILVHGELCEC